MQEEKMQSDNNAGRAGKILYEWSVIRKWQ